MIKLNGSPSSFETAGCPMLLAMRVPVRTASGFPAFRTQ